MWICAAEAASREATDAYSAPILGILEFYPSHVQRKFE